MDANKRELKEYAYHIRDFRNLPPEEAMQKLQKKAEKLGLPATERKIKRLLSSIEGMKIKITSFPLDAEGNAALFAFDNIKTLRYVDLEKNGYWLYWEQNRWVRIGDTKLQKIARKTFKKYGKAASREVNPSRRKALMAHAKKSTKLPQIREMLQLVVVNGKLSIDESGLESKGNTNLLNCLNGMVDLRTGELLPHDRTLYIQQLCPVNYDERAECPTWNRFIEVVTGGDEDYALFLKMITGYALTGETNQKAMFFLQGPTGTGKTTYNEAIGLLLGNYGMAASTSTFTRPHSNGGPTSDIARLQHARFVFASEAGDVESLNTSTVKRLSGQDTIVARLLHQNEFSFKPQFKIFLATNELPRLAGSDDALWKRINVVPFRHRPKKNDLKLMDKFQEELPGILAWAVEGAKLFYEKMKIRIPQVVIDETARTRLEVDPVYAFIQEKCVVGKGEWCKVEEITNAFSAWCIKEEVTYSTDKFWKDLSRLGYLKGKKRVKSDFTDKKEEKRVRQGISVKN